MKDFLHDTIFTNFFYSADLEMDPAQVKRECLEMEEYQHGVVKSNRGGWQSDMFSEDSRYPGIMELRRRVEEFGNVVAAKEGLRTSLLVGNGWANVNREGSFNVPHVHGTTALVVVYYANTPHPAGELVLMRSDGSQLCDLYIGTPDRTRFSIKPVAGRAYAFPSWVVHYVSQEPSKGEPRVSVAFNMYVKR